MITINDIITEVMKVGECGHLKACEDCSFWTFCHVDTIFIALDYIEREGVI